MAKQIVIPKTGEKFGRLEIISSAWADASGRKVVRCLCTCGNFKTVKPSDLRRGAVTSCGCAHADVARKNLPDPIHGMSATPEHHIWRGILTRCRCVRSKYFPRYGGRGITVCERWSAFSNFIEDMGLRPGGAFTIERKNNDGPYSPENCIWATRKTQNRNKRTNRLLSYNGETKPVSQWAEELGIQPVRIFTRLRRGFTTERALTTADLRRSS
jgi:hypothetical protein